MPHSAPIAPSHAPGQQSPTRLKIAGTIAETILAELSNGPRSAQNLYQSLLRSGESTTLTSVYRALYGLRDKGFVADDCSQTAGDGDAIMKRIEVRLAAFAKGVKPSQSISEGKYHLTENGTIAAAFVKVMQQTASVQKLAETRSKRQPFYRLLMRASPQ